MKNLAKLQAYMSGTKDTVLVPKKPLKRPAVPIPTPLYEKPLKPLKDIAIPGLERELFPYQKEGVAFIESRNGRAILGDDMGLGKTAQALGYLQLHLEVRPAIIICPASLKLNWAKEIFMWTAKRDENQVYILSGRKKKLVEEVSIKGSGRLVLTPCKMPKTGIFIINYDVTEAWVFELLKTKPQCIVSDESHYLKSVGTSRTKAVSILAKECPKFIALTGTLIENRPEEAYTVINLVDKKLFPSRWKFCHRYCDPVHNGFGWSFKGASHIPELFIKLKDVMIRRLKEDVLKDLPSKIRSVVPIDIDNKAEYKKAEANLIQWIKENKGLAKAEQASKVEALARMNELKQLCIKGKLESCLNWIEDYLESGKKLVVFCTHTWVLDAVYEEFKQWSVKVDGSVTGIKRNDAVEAFQNNPKVKLFVGNIVAAGVGLTLTASSATCFLELEFRPSLHRQAEDRVHRIGQTAEFVNAYYLLAANTIEEDLALLLDKKQAVVTAVLDGKEVEEISLLDDLMNQIAKGDE